MNTNQPARKRNKGDVRGQRIRYRLRNPSRRRAYWRMYRAQRRAKVGSNAASVDSLAAKSNRV